MFTYLPLKHFTEQYFNTKHWFSFLLKAMEELTFKILIFKNKMYKQISKHYQTIIT